LSHFTIALIFLQPFFWTVIFALYSIRHAVCIAIARSFGATAEQKCWRLKPDASLHAGVMFVCFKLLVMLYVTVMIQEDNDSLVAMTPFMHTSGRLVD